MAVTFSNTNKPLNPRGNDASPLAYNRAALYSGKALSFDGAGDYVDCGTLDVTAYTAISMSFNFQLANITDNGLRLVSLLHSGTDDIRIEQGLSVLRIALDDGTAYTLETPSLTANEWNKFDMTFNGSTLEGYINGVSIGSMSASFNFSTANGLLNLYKHSAASSYAEGLMSGFKLFNTALTPAQIADLYNNPEKIVPTGVDNTALKLWLPMMEGAGTTAYDGSGNGNHGTINGATYVNGIGASVAQTSVIDWNKGTNLLQYTDIANTYFTKDGGTLTTGFEAPDGTNTAFKFARDNSGSGAIFRATPPGLDQNKYRYVYAKLASGTGSAQLLAHNTNTNNTFTITDQWQRFELDSSPAIPTNFYAVDFRGGVGVDEIYLWAPQATAGNAPSVFVPTIGTQQPTPVLLPAGLTTGRDITGVNLFENGRKQGALNLDGQSWAEVHDNASLDYSSEVTLETWVYWTGEADKSFLGRWHGPDSARSLILYANDVDKISAIYSSTGNTTAGSLVASQTLTAGNWYHCVFTSDGTTIKIYVNALEGNSLSYSGGFYVSTKNLEIGTYQTDEDKAYNGQIAQSRIYNRALTASEVLRNYNSGKNTYTNS